MVDLPLEVLQRWQAVEFMVREHFQLSGFSEIRTPLVKTTDLFCLGIGEGADMVGREFRIGVLALASCSPKAQHLWRVQLFSEAY